MGTRRTPKMVKVRDLLRSLSSETWSIGFCLAVHSHELLSYLSVDFLKVIHPVNLRYLRYMRVLVRVLVQVDDVRDEVLALKLGDARCRHAASE